VRRASTFAAACLITVATTLARLATAGAGEPASAAADPAGLVELGRRLFFDPAASSRTGMRSCADCHSPTEGWSDPASQSEDARGRTRRHSQTLIDSYAAPRVHWDGEFGSIEELVRARIAAQPPGPKATGPSREAYETRPPPPSRDVSFPQPDSAPGKPIAFVRADVEDWDFPTPDRVLAASGRYAEGFVAAFGSPQPTVERIAQAIAAFCRSIRSGESAYDRWAAGEASAMTPAAVRGFELFTGPGHCAGCHSMQIGRPIFTDGLMHDTGVESPQKFKTPPLRDVSRRWPYMHDGRLASLYEVARHYLGDRRRGAGGDPLLPTHVARGTDLDDLVAFLRALTSDRVPGEAPADPPARVDRTRLRFVDANGAPLAGREVVLEPAGQELPDADGAWILRTTDADGWIEHAPPRSTHVRVRLDAGMRPQGGAWIPDTCARAEVRLPIRGTGRLDVRFAAGRRPPAEVVLHAEGVTVFPDRTWPTMSLRRAGEQTLEDGGVVARYTGEVRSDLLGVGRWFLGELSPKRGTVLLHLDRFHVEEVDLTR
jgi:cytochrome c peroxidase